MKSLSGVSWLDEIRQDASKKISDDYKPIALSEDLPMIESKNNLKEINLSKLDAMDRKLAKRLVLESSLYSSKSQEASYILANLEHCSVFIVDKGKKAELSISYKDSRSMHFVLLSEGSSIRLISEAKSDCMSSIDVFAEENAHSHLAFMKPKGCTAYHSVGAKLKTGSCMNTYSFWSGDGIGENRIKLNGAGSSARDITLSTAGKREEVWLKNTVEHNSNLTRSGILMKGVAQDSSHTHFEGEVSISGGGQRSASDLSQHIMLLDKGSIAEAKPVMEIMNNDVECSHSASVRFPDENKLFYLMSRGLDLDMARTSMMTGFLRSAIDEIQDNKLKNKFMPPFMRYSGP